jgi:hypothetical protein
MLDLMFQSGLTAELIDTLAVLDKYIPHQKIVVQERLLDETTKVLGGGTVFATISLPRSLLPHIPFN